MPVSSAQRMWIIKVAGIDGNWQTFSGGERTAEVSRNYDGGSLTPETIASPAETANVVVSRSYQQARDAAVFAALRQKVGRWRTTVSKTPTNEDMVTVGQPVTYSNALLVRISEPEADSSSGDVSMFELEFAVGSVA